MSSISQSSPLATRVATPVPDVKDEEKRAQDATLTTVSTHTQPDAEPQSPPPNPLSTASTTRKLVLMAAFTFAQFLDAFNNSALFPAVPVMSRELGLLQSETVWLISAYQLTFAAFLLISGRISDVYAPKPAFIVGALLLGTTHLIGGFISQKIGILVLRALGGVGGALTIPSALSLITQLFPDERSQSRAIAIFGGSGAIGNVLGLIIGALFVEYTSWNWIFWFTAIVAITVAVICFVFIPNTGHHKIDQSFDVIGISTLTSAIILFIFAVTSAASQGWGTAYVLAPLIISLVLVGIFFFWESRLDPKDAAIPPSLWRYPNIPVLVGVALLPYFWWVSIFLNFTDWWQTRYGWSAINTAVHFLPLGVLAWIVTNFAGYLPRWFQHKHIILFGGVLTLIASAILPFSDSPDTYWRLTFPAFIIGTWGCTHLFSNTYIAVFVVTPAEMAGTVGAIFNSALQLGSAVGLAVIITIQTSVDAREHVHDIVNPTTKSEWRHAYRGRFAVSWFVFAVVALEILSVLIFFRPSKSRSDDEETVVGEKAQAKDETRVNTLDV